jgi:hypothetical protein
MAKAPDRRTMANQRQQDSEVGSHPGPLAPMDEVLIPSNLTLPPDRLTSLCNASQCLAHQGASKAVLGWAQQLFPLAGHTGV